MNGDITELLQRHGTSLEETRKLVPKLTEAIAKERALKPPAFPKVSQFFTPEEAREWGIELEPDWMLKVTPPVEGAEPSFSFITPEKWEITQAQEYISPEGQKFTREQIEAQLAAPEVPLEIEQVFGEVFPGREIEELITYARTQPEALATDLWEIGRTPEVEELLRTAFDFTEKQIEEFFAPVEEAPLTEIAKEAWRQAEWLAPPAEWSEAVKGFPGLMDLMQWLAPTKLGAGLGVVGAYLETYVGRPWEVCILNARARFQLATGMGSDIDRAALEGIEKAIDKYGWAMFFSEEVSDIWHDYLQKTYGPAKITLEISEWLNPAYWIPIGGAFGVAAKFTSKVPVLGKGLRLTAGGVKAVERGITYPVAKPLEMGIKYGAKGMERVGVKLGEKLANRLIRETDNLLLEIPESEALLNGVLVDNWMRRTLTIAAKIPPIRVGIEKGLGWRILLKRQGQAVEDIVSRAAVVHAEISRMGLNAKAPKLWELRAIEMNPVKYFGFSNKAFSSKMFKRLLPEYKGLAEGGTLEHVFTHPEMYGWKGMERGLEYVTKLHELNTEVLNLLKKEGVAPEHLTEDWWMHRVVEGKFNAEEELIKLRGRPGVRRGRIGAKPSFEMHRKAPTMAEGIAWGIQYNRNPEVAITSYIEGAFKKIADSRVVKYLEPFGIAPTERLAARFPEIVERAALTKTELADAAKFHSVINRVARGEKIPAQTLAAMERRFPELGERLRIVIREAPDRAVPFGSKAEELLAKYKPLLNDVEKIDLLKNPKAYNVASQKLEAFVSTLTKQERNLLDKALRNEAILRESSLSVELFDYPRPINLGKGVISRKDALEALRKEIKALTEARKAPYWQARAERAFRMEQIRQPGIGEGYIMQPFAGGRIYTQEFIDAFNKFFGHEAGLPGFNVTSDIAGILRITKAALDFSQPAIQGLPSWGLAHAYLLFNPPQGLKLMGAWYKTFVQSTAAFFHPEILARALKGLEAPTMQRIACGGSAHAVDYFQTLWARGGLAGLAEKGMAKLPFKPYHRAEITFFGAGELVRDRFWKILSPKALARGQEFELARFLDRFTGITDSATLGVPITTRQLEQTFMWFAPNYTRACLTVLADVFRGGMTGAETRKALAGMIAAGSAMYSGVQYAIATIEGKSNEEAWETVKEGFCVYEDPITHEVEWKPSARFMTLKIGNYYMGFGGFWYGLLRLGGNIMACVNEVGERERIDLVRIIKNGSFNKRDNPFIYWWFCRASPFFGVGFELASGKDFLGYPIETPMDYAIHIATRFEPIWMEQGLNWMVPGLARDNEIPEGMARAALVPAEIFGLRTFPESTWVNFYDKVNEYIKHIPFDELDEKQKEAWREGKLEWKHLTELQKANLLSRYPELQELFGEAQADSAIRNSPHWKAWQGRMDEEREIYYKRIEELTQRLLLGEIDTREYRELAGEAGQNYGSILEAIERDPNYAEIYDFFDRKEAEGDKYGFLDDIALAELQSTVLYAEDLIDDKGDYDWDERDRRIDTFIEKWGQDTYDRLQQYIAQKKGLADLNEVWIRKASDTEKLGRGYWRLPYQPIIDMDEEDEDEGNIPAEYYALWKEYQALETDAEREAFISRHPEMAKDWRAEYRKAHPEDDARLALWGYGGKLRSREAYEFVVKWSRELGIPLEQMGLGLPPHSLIDQYFDYADITTKFSGNSAEARLFRLENPEWDTWGQENWGWKPVPEDTSVEALRITAKYRDMDKEYEAIEGTEDRQAFLEAYAEYADARRRRDAYNYDFPDNLVETYVQYYKIPRAGYEDDWFLMEHPEFYQAALELLGWQERDFSKVPSREVYALLQSYFKIPKGKERLVYRHNHPELEGWLVKVKGYTPVGDRWINGKEAGKEKEEEKTPWEEAEEARRIKEWIEGQT